MQPVLLHAHGTDAAEEDANHKASRCLEFSDGKAEPVSLFEHQQLPHTVSQTPLTWRHTQKSKGLDVVDILPERRIDLIRVQHTGMVPVIRMESIQGTRDTTYNRWTVG